MPKTIIGIDPGVTGAIAILIDGEARVMDMPVCKVRIGGHERNVPIWLELNMLFTEIGYECTACMETSWPRPNQGVKAAWTTGACFMGVVALLSSHSIPYRTVTPGTWKKHFNLIKQPKDASRKVAMELFPKLADQLKLKKHHNRAEALLIAEYCRRQQ